MRNLKLGDQIRAYVEEVLPESALIVSVEGELFRVMNETGQKLKAKDRLTMTVVAVNPMMFKMQKYDELRFERFV